MPVIDQAVQLLPVWEPPVGVASGVSLAIVTDRRVIELCHGVKSVAPVQNPKAGSVSEPHQPGKVIGYRPIAVDEKSGFGPRKSSLQKSVVFRVLV